MSCQRLTVVFALLAAALAAQDKQRLTYQDTRERISWQGPVPSARWAPDGIHVELGSGKDRLWFDPATGKSEPGQPARPQPASANRRKVLRLYEGDLWLEEVAPAGGRRGMRGGRRGGRGKPGAEAVRLTVDGVASGRKAEAHLSPDKAWVSYTRDNNLVLLDIEAGKQWAVTDDGGNEMFHGILDWVYQEELYGRGDFQGHWWSPGSDMVAFLSLDESPVRDFTVINHVPPDYLDKERAVVPEITNYPKAGDPNPLARLSVAHTASRDIVSVDLSGFAKDVLVVRVDWTPDGKTMLVTLQDRIQTWAELCGCDPKTGKLETWIREESPTWVNRPASPRWLEDGTFLWLSERTGYQHVYHYEKGGKLLSAATAGEWQVRRIVRVDEKARRIWFEGTKDGATGRHLYRTGFDGQGLVCLTPGIGTHSFELNPAGTFLIDRWSTMDTPTKVAVRSGETGEIVKQIGQADRGDGESRYAFAPRQRLTIKARDGYLLDASVMLPIGWQKGKRYPVFLPTYSGPDAPSVRDSWRYSTYDQFLAQEGFVILQVNVRSASGRGQHDTGMAYKQLGVPELRDLEDAVDHVCANFGGDPERVAISGWSYGGFMAAFALTHSKKFALGLAGAGVYDWRLYDTIYTERYMRTPQENPEGYDATSCIKAAKNLHGHLVVIHGTMDDNVHVQNAMQLIWALQSAGKQNFELMLYPRSRHGLNRAVSGHSRELQWLRLKKLLAR